MVFSNILFCMHNRLMASKDEEYDTIHSNEELEDQIVKKRANIYIYIYIYNTQFVRRL